MNRVETLYYLPILRDSKFCLVILSHFQPPNDVHRNVYVWVHQPLLALLFSWKMWQTQSRATSRRISLAHAVFWFLQTTRTALWFLSRLLRTQCFWLPIFPIESLYFWPTLFKFHFSARKYRKSVKTKNFIKLKKYLFLLLSLQLLLLFLSSFC